MTHAAVPYRLLRISQRYRDAASEVLQHVRNGTFCALIGPRFSGKSEMLQAVRQALDAEPSWLCVDVNLRQVDAPTQARFFSNLAALIIHDIHLRTEACPQYSPHADSSVTFRAFLLQCIEQHGRDLVLTIEHLEALPTDLIQALLTSLRAAYMDQQDSGNRLVAVISGALSLAKRTVGESSPLRGIAERVLVGELSETESEALAAQYLLSYKTSISPAARRCLLLAGQGDPALLAWLCERCVQVAGQSAVGQLTANTVKHAVLEFVRHEACHYAPLQEAIGLIEDDPDLLRCTLLLLQQDQVPIRSLPLPLSPDLDPLYLTGVVRKVGDNAYEVRNSIYRQYLASYFDTGRVGHLLSISGRWDLAIDYLQQSVVVGNQQYRPDLIAATINSMYASENVRHAAHYLARGLSIAFAAEDVQIWHAVPGLDVLRLAAREPSADGTTLNAEIQIGADVLEARAFRQMNPLRGAETLGVVKRAMPLLVAGSKPIGVAAFCSNAQNPGHQTPRESELQLLGYLNQAARALHEVQARQRQLLRIAELEMERTAQELQVARQIQRSLLPESCPSRPGWEVCADWRAAREVGGDFYDFIPLDARHMGIVIGDVSDKGVPAALYMNLARTLVRTCARDIRSPASALQRANDLMVNEGRSGMFVTLFYGVLDWETGQLVYANAGHNPPILWQTGALSPDDSHGAESLDDPRRTLLSAKGMVLGVVEDIVLEERTITLQPHDILLLYTDGVTEPINADGEEFGETRLLRTIETNGHKTCQELVAAIQEAMSGFVGNQPPYDDYTLVGIKLSP